MMHNQKGSVTIVLVIILMMSAVGFGVWRYVDTQQETPSAQHASPAPPPNNAGSDHIVQQIPEGFILYEHKQAGFSLAYPKSWGEVEIKDFDSPGKGDAYLYGKFSKSSAVTFGGDRKDYSHDGRGVAPTDYPGYVKQGSAYFMYSNFGQAGDLAEIENAASLEEVKASNTTGLYQKGAQFGADFDSITKYDIIRFNLTKPPYFGVNIVLKLDGGASSKDRQLFLQTAETFRLL